jgi:hypothetical protein
MIPSNATIDSSRDAESGVPGGPLNERPAWGGRLWDAFVVLLLLLPPLCCALLVKQNAVNSPHYDDFTFSEDWLKYKTGQLTWNDLFSVHLEHRVTVPRLIALGLHRLGGADIRWQNGFSVLLLLGTFVNLLVIWRRTGNATIRSSWLPLFLISSLLFCAVQWQPLLWAILFEIFVGIWALTLALRIWAGPQRPWLALAWSVPLCVAATLSFGNGLLSWLLIPFAIWFQRPELPAGTRWRLIGAWLGCFAITMQLYFHDFHNSAPPQFAYNYGSNMTALDTAGSTLGKLSDGSATLKALRFFLTVLGSHLCRGLHLNSLPAAEWIGGISAALFLGALALLLIARRDSGLLRRAMPWVLFGLYSLGTAALITLGRASLTRSGITALLPRYLSHAVPLTVSLVGLAWILGQHFAPRRAWLRTAGLIAGGALLALTVIEWIYGARQMEAWRYARLQGQAMMKFTNVISDKSFLGPVSGSGEEGARLISGLNRIGESPVRLLGSLRLSEFQVSKLTLRHRQAAFTELHDTESGGLIASGYAELPDQRPADLVLFSTPDASGEPQVFGFTFLLRLPNYLRATTAKDHDWLFMDEFDPSLYARWEGHLALAMKPPRGAPISAWALDVIHGRIYRIPDHRTTPEPLPPLPRIPLDSE